MIFLFTLVESPELICCPGDTCTCNDAPRCTPRHALGAHQPFTPAIVTPSVQPRWNWNHLSPVLNLYWLLAGMGTAWKIMVDTHPRLKRTGFLFTPRTLDTSLSASCDSTFKQSTKLLHETFLRSVFLYNVTLLCRAGSPHLWSRPGDCLSP